MTPEALLALDPMDAVYEIAQSALDLNHPGVVSRWYRAGQPLVVNGATTRVIFTLDKVKTPVTRWDSPVSFQILYDRLDLSQFIPTDFLVQAPKPTTKKTLLIWALRDLKIPVGLDDIEDVEVNDTGTVNLQASETSYRWVGSATVSYQSVTYTLTELVKRNNLVTNYTPNYNSIDIRHDLVNHLNAVNEGRLPYTLNLGDLQICVPMENERYSSPRNTKVKVKAVQGDFTGEVFLIYRRRSFESTWRKPAPVERGTALSTRDLIPVINQALRVELSTTDVIDEPLPGPIPWQTVDAVVRFNPESMGFVGDLKVTLMN